MVGSDLDLAVADEGAVDADASPLQRVEFAEEREAVGGGGADAGGVDCLLEAVVAEDTEELGAETDDLRVEINACGYGPAQLPKMNKELIQSLSVRVFLYF